MDCSGMGDNLTCFRQSKGRFPRHIPHLHHLLDHLDHLTTKYHGPRWSPLCAFSSSGSGEIVLDNKYSLPIPNFQFPSRRRFRVNPHRYRFVVRLTEWDEIKHANIVHSCLESSFFPSPISSKRVLALILSTIHVCHWLVQLFSTSHLVHFFSSGIHNIQISAALILTRVVSMTSACPRHETRAGYSSRGRGILVFGLRLR